MKKHGFLKAISGYTIVLGKDQQVFDAGIMGRCQIFLQLESIFITGGCLVYGVKPVLFQQITCFNIITHHTFQFDF